MPGRIQRKRSKGWKWPEGAVYVGRPSDFGNPFTVSTKRRAGTLVGFGYRIVPTVEDAIECFRLYLAERPDLLRRVRDELHGKNLMCWCPLDQPCHADVLLEIANELETV